MKLLYLIIVFFISINVHCQTPFEKGRKIKNFSLSRNISTYNETLEFDFKYLKIIKNNIAVGLKAGINYGWDDNDESNFNSDYGSFKFMPTVRFFNSKTPSSLYFGEFSIGKSAVEVDGYGVDGFSNQMEFNLGYAYFINKNIAIEPIVFFERTSYKESRDNGFGYYSYKYNILNYGLNMSLNLYFDKLKMPALFKN